MGKNMELELSQELDTTLTFTLDMRLALWSSRFARCGQAGAPEMVVALTNMIENVADRKTQRRFKRINAAFVNAVMAELTPFLSDVNSGLDMGCGPGLFYIPLMNYIPMLFGIDLVPEVIHYLRMKILKSAGPQKTALMRRVKPIAAHEVGKIAYEEPFNLQNLDRIFLFRAALHWPEEECQEALQAALSFLKTGGLVCMSELFQEDIDAFIPDRPKNKGTYYRKLSDYQEMLPGTRVIHRSEPHYNDTDPCRVVVFEKI